MRSSWTLRPSEGDTSGREVRVGMHFAEVVNLASKGRVAFNRDDREKWSFALLRLERCVQEAQEEEIEERKKKYSLASIGE